MKNYKVRLIILIIILLGLVFEIFKNSLKEGDFVGYAEVGNLVIKGEYLYKNPYINTWPPFFSIACVPIAVADNFNNYLIRFIWLVLTIVALFYSTRLILCMTIKKKLVFYPLKIPETDTKNISILNPVIFIPMLLSLRALLDNLGNIQINVFILWMVVLSLYLFSKDKQFLSALIMAFAISIKVYPIFIFLYFVVKREYKLIFYTMLFTALFSFIPVLVFGLEQTIEYYKFWYQHNVEPFASVGHKNQSFFSMMRSLLTHDSPGLNSPLNQEIYINFLNLSIEQVKIVSYAIIAIPGAFIVYLFRKKLTSIGNLQSFLEYAFVLTLIPILSPLSWKAYFIFLFPGFFINYLFIFRIRNKLNKAINKYLKTSFFISIILTIMSAELFVGRYFSDIMEVFSSITIGTILLSINIILFYVYFDKFEKQRVSE